jgi:Gram-negative bacterial TonB protein C-terminal
MRPGTLLFALILASGNVGAGDHRPAAPWPDQFVVGRDAFFDFGPPFDYYEIFVVRAQGAGTSAVRILLSPAADECYSPAKVEVATAHLDESVGSLPGNTNPCAIPEKELHHEMKRCKHCLLFSGSRVTMQVPCGEKMRRIRFNVLEQDWFLAHPNTPRNTFWSIGLLTKLDEALGPGPMDKPVFPLPEQGSGERIALDPDVQKALEDGGYDELFAGAQDKVSKLLRDSQVVPPQPLVTLKNVFPVQPESFALPDYPRISRLAHVSGIVTVSGIIGSSGAPTFLVAQSGPKLLQPAAMNAVAQWKFPPETRGQMMSAALEFDLNCPAKDDVSP